MRSIRIVTLAAAMALSLSAVSSRAEAPRLVNVTSDSAPGWTPSAEQEKAATAAVLKYLATRDAGHAKEAYSQLDPLDAQEMSFGDFSRLLESFNRQAGPVVERRVTKLTWTKDPPNAPEKGIYAAFDLVSRFKGIDRHCGYVVMRQSEPGGAFLVMREESTFMDNATADEIAKKSSSAAVADAWAKVATVCPNYKPPLPEVEHSTIEYPTVAAALTGLHAKPGVRFSQQNGWTIATDEKTMTIWSFAPPGNPAYPAVVKRQVLERDGGTWIDTGVECESSKEACDDLVRSFNELNAQAGARR